VSHNLFDLGNLPFLAAHSGGGGRGVNHTGTVGGNMNSSMVAKCASQSSLS